ncbi:MAG TPA: hypothetical protein DDY79_04915 [Brevundimonas sp.]|nr:hypothetical protein [Brevundimonas sp.]
MQAAAPALVVVVATLISAFVVGAAFSGSALDWTAEAGPVETATVCLYGVVILAALLFWRQGQAIGALVGVAALLMALRELDAHAAFTRFGVFSTRLYARPDVPLAEKIAAATAVALLAVLVIAALRGAWRDLTGRAPVPAATLAVLVVFGLVLKQIDALPRQLHGLGLPLPEGLLSVSKAVEEIGEMALPLLLALALVQLPHRRRR